VCWGSAVFRIIFLHIVGREPTNLEREDEFISAVSIYSAPAPQSTRKAPSCLRAFAPAIPSTQKMYHLNSLMRVSFLLTATLLNAGNGAQGLMYTRQVLYH
jgi:hypothetical protein